MREYSDNFISENMLTRVDSDGSYLTTTERVIDYKKDEPTAVSKSDMHVMTRRGQTQL